MKSTSGSIHFFGMLGDRVEQLWAMQNYEERSFPEAAMSSLQEYPPNKNVTFYDAVRIGLLTNPIPPQQDLEAKFGQPPLTVYVGRDFRIELLFWVEGLPGVHQHGFSGAFHVLSGSSLHTKWAFDEDRRITSRLLLGKISLISAEVLDAGSNSPIIAGNQMIHSTFHLDRPSVTCVVRTNRDLDRLPQFSYLPPSVAYTPLDNTPVIERRRQLLRMLVSSNRWSEYFDIMAHLLEESDIYAIFHYLQDLFPQLPERAERNTLIAMAYHRFPELIANMAPAFAEQERRRRVLELRRKITNSDLQFFMAILLNVPSQSTMLSLVKKRYPLRDPRLVVLNWITELSQSGSLEVQWPDSWIAAAKRLLFEAPNQEASRAAITDTRNVRLPTVENDSLCRDIADYWLFKSLLTIGE